jgi:pimeloyl-ACP methyl ester carboxylesterase
MKIPNIDILGGLGEVVRRILVFRGVKSSFVEIGGYRVHHYVLEGTGRGPPILLVHGLGGSANGFYKVLSGLSKRFSRVIALDLPGNGFSPLPEGGALSLLQLFEVLAAFCAQVVRAPAYVVGNSLGGAMSITLAHRHPEHVRALALVAPAGARVPEERLKELFLAMQCETNAQAVALTRRLFHRAPIGALLLSSELRKVYGSPAVRAIFSELRSTDFLEPEVLASVSMPTLLLWGGSEKLLPYEGIDYFRAHLPKTARIDVVPGFGHVPQMERPGELIRHLSTFADQCGL